MDHQTLLQVLVFVLMLLILGIVLLQAKSMIGKRKILNIQPGVLMEKEGWDAFLWVSSSAPQNFYVVPAVRVVDAFPALASDKSKLIGRFLEVFNPLADIILDAVVVSYDTGMVVAIAQRPNDKHIRHIKQVAFDAGVPLIDVDLAKTIPWEKLNASVSST
ncbi:hypothetical protein [Acetobacter persici]|uniref:hypothetical protein n=1 Tax=Acetobacter persici TaxID=1076596 RepID=UPI001BA5023B|nr:hypothetical protein [Acetobacter persici]MBS1017091.1 hypothetical protein [Acetobacter persici]